MTERFELRKPIALIADSDQESCEQLKALLEGQKVSSIRAQKSDDALLAFLESGPAVIFIDMLLPSRGGFDLAERIRKAKFGDSVSIFFLNSLRSSTAIEREAVDRLGALAVLQKPLNQEQVTKAIGKLFPQEVNGAESLPNEIVYRETPHRGDATQAEFTALIAGIMARRESCQLAVGSAKTRKIAYFKDGRLEFCASNLISETLGRHLVSEYGLDVEEYRKSIELMIESKRKIGEILLERGSIQEETLKKALVTNVIDKFHDIFRWSNCWYRVLPYQKPPTDLRGTVIESGPLLWDALWDHLPDEVSESILGPHAHRRMRLIEQTDDWADELPEGLTRRTVQKWARKLDGTTLDENIDALKKRKALKTSHYLLMRGHLDFTDENDVGYGRRRSGAWDVDVVGRQVELAAKYLKQLSNLNHFQVLGVKLNASDADIRNAFRALSLRYHPDALDAEAPEELRQLVSDIFVVIGEAYEVLSDDGKRADYRKAIEMAAVLSGAQEALAAEAAFQQGLAHFRRKNWDEAVAEFRKAVSKNENEAEYQLQLGLALLRSTHLDRERTHEEAVTALRKATIIDPNLPAPHYELGKLFLLRGEEEKAAVYLIGALNRAPRDKDIRRHIQLLHKRCSKKLSKKLEAILGTR